MSEIIDDIEVGTRESKLASFAADWLQNILAHRNTGKTPDDHSWSSMKSLNQATWILGMAQISLLILFATVTGSEVLDSLTAPGTGTQGYNMFIGVEVMM